VTGYGLDGPAIETRPGGGRGRFHALVQTDPLEPTRVIPGGKAAEAWRLPPPPSNDEVKEG